MKKMLSWYTGCERGNNIMIIGAGASLRKYITPIKYHIANNNFVTIGINKMTDFIVPDYHLWTNNQRFRDQMGCISPSSELMLGCGLSDYLVSRVATDYIEIKYKSEKTLSNNFHAGVLYGHYRTAGVLAIAVANLLNGGDGKILVVGMDGFTLYRFDNLINKKENHHCYGAGFTNDATYQECIVKDKLVLDGLQDLKKSGVDFNIVTPTKYNEFYDDVLGLQNA